MKKIFVFSLVLFSIFLFSQDFKKSIAQEACKCVKENVKDDMSEKQVQLKFGICMMKVTAPYKKEIKKEFGIDLDDYSKKELSGFKRVKLQKELLHFQYSLKRLVSYT